MLFNNLFLYVSESVSESILSNVLLINVLHSYTFSFVSENKKTQKHFQMGYEVTCCIINAYNIYEVILPFIIRKSRIIIKQTANMKKILCIWVLTVTFLGAFPALADAQQWGIDCQWSLLGDSYSEYRCGICLPFKDEHSRTCSI